MMSLAYRSTCYFFYGYCLLGDFYVLNVCIEYEEERKAGVLYVVQRCVYYALHVGKMKTHAINIKIFLKSLRERRLKRG
jgi:hypothetical protein